MKKNTFFWTVMLGALSVAGCQNDFEPAAGDDAGQQINCFFGVDNNLWTNPPEASAPSSRTIYEPGIGLHLKGTENISVYYGYTLEDGTRVISNGSSVKSVNTGGTYSFTHDPVTEANGKYNYYFILPYASTNGKNTTSGKTYGTSTTSVLSPIQMPTASSPDSENDYLFGQSLIGVDVADPQTTGSSVDLANIRFKRFFAPFKITLLDPDGLLNKEPVQSVTLSTDQAATQSQALVGMFYATPSDSYANCKITSWYRDGIGTSVTAEYPKQLAAASDGSYSIWYMVNPITLKSGASFTLTVTTATRTLTRTTTLPRDLKFETYAINSLSFNMTASESTVQKSFTQSFGTNTGNGSYAKGDTQLVASDGTTYTWNLTASAESMIRLYNMGRQDAPVFCLSLESTKTAGTNSCITLPNFTDKTVTKLKIFEGPTNARNAANTFMVGTVDGVWSVSCDFNGYTLMSTGGIAEIEIPAEQRGKQLKIYRNTTASAQRAMIENITFIYE